MGNLTQELSFSIDSLHKARAFDGIGQRSVLGPTYFNTSFKGISEVYPLVSFEHYRSQANIVYASN